MLQAIIAILTSLPTILKLAEKLIAIYESGVKKNEAVLLQKAKEKADDEVTSFITRVRASNSVRESSAGVSGEPPVNATSGDNECGDLRSKLYERGSFKDK